MAIFKKRDKQKDEPVKPTEDVLSVLKEIRDKLPSREDQIFAAVLSGAISRQGVLNSEGKPALALIELARQFTKEI